MEKTSKDYARKMCRLSMETTDGATQLAFMDGYMTAVKETNAEELAKQNELLLEALELALPYVKGAYECAFPEESENAFVQDLAETAIERAKPKVLTP